MTTNGILIFSTPRALDLGHRVACSPGATRVLDPLEYGRKATERRVGDDYMAVVQQVVQVRSSGIKGREGSEYLILVHPGITDLPKDTVATLKARLDGILKNKAPQWVSDRQVWHGANEALVLELTVLSDALNEFSSLLPSVDISDMPAKPIADVLPISSPSPEPHVSVRRRPVSWKVWLVVIAAFMGIAAAFIVSSDSRDTEEPTKPPKEPLNMQEDDFSFLPKDIRPRTEERREAVRQDINKAIESLAIIIKRVSESERVGQRGLSGWLCQNKDVSLPTAYQLGEQWACILSFLRALENQSLVQSDNELDLASLIELDLSFITKLQSRDRDPDKFKPVVKEIQNVVDLAFKITHPQE